MAPTYIHTLHRVPHRDRPWGIWAACLRPGPTRCLLFASDEMFWSGGVVWDLKEMKENIFLNCCFMF